MQTEQYILLLCCLFRYRFAMANIDKMFRALKRKLEEGGDTDIKNPEVMANEVAEFIKKRRMEAGPSGSHAGPSGSHAGSSGSEPDQNIEFEDYVPVFSTSGVIVLSFSTLD